MADIMEFVRGDQANHTFSIPTSSWSAGGRLYFAAKQVVDDDTTDAAAQIQGNWDDTVVTDKTINGIAYKQYACAFSPAATNSIVSDGADTLELKGEFQWVDSGGLPTTFPPTDDKIVVIVYFDIKRKITV